MAEHPELALDDAPPARPEQPQPDPETGLVSDAEATAYERDLAAWEKKHQDEWAAWEERAAAVEQAKQRRRDAAQQLVDDGWTVVASGERDGKWFAVAEKGVRRKRFHETKGTAVADK